MLTVEILSKLPTNQNDHSDEIEFSCYDGEDSMQVSFIGKISIAHAFFIAEHLIGLGDEDAYSQFIQYIIDNPFDKLEIGKSFVSE